MTYPSVPVIMYHNVGVPNKNWLWGHLTCPWKLFEEHLLWIRKINIETISLQQLYDYKSKNADIPSRPIVLTFDDGYLDNWIFAYPLLKKHECKGTIFINPEFVDPRQIIRKNLEDVWYHGEEISNLETDGFLSWQEIKIMESEGVFDVQSHSMSHTWYFCDKEIIDFHSPGNNKYPWIFWNMKQEQKSFYITNKYDQVIPYGLPVYKNGRSLGIRRYLEDQDLSRFVVDFVGDQGVGIFNENNWRKKLYDQVDKYKSMNKLNERFETDNEQKERYVYELKKSKEIIEEKLDKTVRFLCWPGGVRNALSTKISRDVGYMAYTVSAVKGGGTNTYSEDPAMIFRVGPPNIQKKGKIYYMGGLAFILRYFSIRMNLIARLIQKCMRGYVQIQIMLGMRRNGIIINS